MNEAEIAGLFEQGSGLNIGNVGLFITGTVGLAAILFWAWVIASAANAKKEGRLEAMPTLFLIGRASILVLTLIALMIAQQAFNQGLNHS